MHAAKTSNDPDADSMSPQDAQAFARQWLAMLDSLAPIDDYLKFLPEGDFEQWSYPDVDIRNADELKSFYQKTWGAIAKQSNTIRALTSQPAPGGRQQVDVDVHWQATTAAGASFGRDLHYTMVVGSGACAHDPSGAHPKVYRYKITRP